MQKTIIEILRKINIEFIFNQNDGDVVMILLQNSNWSIN